ncbi:MAG: DEAD/DEAH box helicase family protein [Nitrospiraceae bacterium]|nr:DEAD/DEAH box helicase family protein [Nitrospiraceae bacterium]
MAEWYDVETTAKYLGISQSNLYSLAQDGRIPANRIGKVWRFNKDDLDKWVKANKPFNEFFVSVQADTDGNPLLRDPQKEAHGAALDFFSSPQNKQAIVLLPVGCGKSGLISILPFGIAQGRILVIAPNVTIRTELFDALNVSNRRKCFWRKTNVISEDVMAAGPYVALLDGKDANIHDCDRSHIVLTNIQQLASRADRWLSAFPDNFFDMILVDEGHHSAAPSWKKVFNKFPNAKVINLTATPFRSDRKQIDGELIYRYSFKRAMLKGYIKKLQAIYVAPDELYFTYKGKELHLTLDEVLQLKEEDWFSRGVALSMECNRNIVDASLDRLEKLRESGTQHQLIAVACSIAHAKAIRSLYAERGYGAEIISSEMTTEKQDEVLQKLKSGLLDCIIQVQMLGEGFDHPHLSVAAIFRPFRSLAPYIQFIGRIMRVIVQSDPRHPDNYGYVVTHVGLNTDRLLEDFKDMEREDKEFFENLISGDEPEPPEEVLSGDARKKLSEDMVVQREIISNFFEEDFIDPDDEVLIAELKAQAEALGFDAATLDAYIRGHAAGKRRAVDAASPFPVQPQKERIEAKKRLDEEVKRTAKLLLNRLEISIAGRDLPFKLAPGTSGTNFTAAVQLINREINKRLEIEPGKRNTLKTADYQRGIQELKDVLDYFTRLFQKRKAEENEKR